MFFIVSIFFWQDKSNADTFLSNRFFLGVKSFNEKQFSQIPSNIKSLQPLNKISIMNSAIFPIDLIKIMFQVSWIRHSDLHILTVGRYTYTADNRYQSIYNPTTDEWILQVFTIFEENYFLQSSTFASSFFASVFS